MGKSLTWKEDIMLNRHGPATDMAGARKKLLGRSLVENGLITEAQLDEGLKQHKRSKQKLGAALIRLGYVSQEDIMRSIAGISNMEYIDLERTDVHPDATSLISRAMAERFNVVPLKLENGNLHIVADMPLTPQIQDNIRKLAGHRPVLYLSTSARIKGVLKEIYDGGVSAIDFSEDAAIIKLVDGLIEKAIRERASDMHFETGRDGLRVRFRIDGLLREIETHPISIAPPLISRIKVISNLNIAEKRSPQDGAFTFKNGLQSIDLRVSVLPNIYGEKAVLRLLNTQNRSGGFESLGMEDDTRQLFESLLRRPHGIILLASPTGSGKSTTLYTALTAMRNETTNITTVEDPVEYKIDGITQVQVDAAMKVTFPTALRSILRQDPDIIMIGEIRDRETAEIALQSALTGHLVLATIHTNDAPGALTRLIDMGCEPFLVSSTVCGVMAQRLIRANCSQCKTSFDPTVDELKRFGLDRLPEGAQWFSGQGCRHCHNAGFKDRIAIFELFKVSREIQQAVVKKSSAEKIRDVALANGMRSLFDDGILKIHKGITAPEEVMRITILE